MNSTGSTDGHILRDPKKSFKEKYPNLSKEIDNLSPSIELHFETPENPVKSQEPDPLQGFLPSVIDYIRRCSSLEEALEIIAYLESRKEITSEEAHKLKTQLNTQGLESFGLKKTWGYYNRMSSNQDE